MNNVEAIRILECIATDITGALMDANDNRNPGVLMQQLEAIDLAQRVLRDASTQGWISVGDKRPDPGLRRISVLATDGREVFPIDYVKATVRGKAVDRWEYLRNRIYRGNEITHWMPLPQPPKEDNHES